MSRWNTANPLLAARSSGEMSRGSEGSRERGIKTAGGRPEFWGARRKQGIAGFSGFMGQVVKQAIMRLINTWCGVAPGAGAQVFMLCALDSDNVPITRCAREVNRRQVSRRKEGAGALAGEMMSCRFMRGLSARGRGSDRDSMVAISSQLSAFSQSARIVGVCAAMAGWALIGVLSALPPQISQICADLDFAGSDAERERYLGALRMRTRARPAFGA